MNIYADIFMNIYRYYHIYVNTHKYAHKSTYEKSGNIKK